MDHKAYEKHQATLPKTNHEVREPDAIDPFDGVHTNTEIAIMAVVIVMAMYAVWQIVRPKNKKEDQNG